MYPSRHTLTEQEHKDAQLMSKPFGMIIYTIREWIKSLLRK